MPGPMYRTPETELSQGDIVDDVPHFRVRPPLEIVRRWTAKGGREWWIPFPYPPVVGKTPDTGKTIKLPPFNVKEGEVVPVSCRFTRALILNYDCDLQHEEDHCLVAMVRPITGVHEEDRPTIRENRNFNYFHLPADDDLGLAEGYVDFRQLTCFDPELLDIVGTRKASLTHVGVAGLHSQMFRFFTRRDLIPSSP
jgi:hypothetical protein